MTDDLEHHAFSPRVLLIGDEPRRGRESETRLELRELVERLPDVRGVVVGRSDAAPCARVRRVPAAGPTLLRWLRLTRIIRAEASEAEIIDAEVARQIALALMSGALRGKKIVARFEGPPPADGAQTLRGRFGAALDRHVCRRSALVITTNDRAARDLIERVGVSPWRVRVESPTGLPGRFEPGGRARARRRLGLPAAAFVACYVNAPVPYDEAALLLDTWGRLVAEHRPDATRPVRLLLASTGERRGELRTTTIPASLSESINVLGRVDGAELADLLRAADVNVAAGSSERLATVALAAAACGTPSIATAGLVDGLTGLEASLELRDDGPAALAARLAAAAAGALPDRQATRDWALRRQWEQLVAERRRIYAELDPRHPRAPRKVRVVFVGHVAALSGGEIALARLVEALGQVDAHVILAEDGPLIERLHAAGASVEVFALGERTRSLRRDRVRATGFPIAALADTGLYVLRLARRIRAIQPDLVHTNTLKAGVYGSLAARLARVPVVWHVRDRIASDYLPRSTARSVRALIATLPDAVIVNSAATGQTLWHTRGQTSAINSPIPDPVSWHWVARAPGPHRFVIGMIGRIAPWKGQHVFIDALARAFADGDELGVIVGSAMFGAEEVEYETSLHERARSLGLSERIVFRGFRSDVFRELIGMDVCVHASTTPEPFGQVVVEAMLAGTPVIATDAGGPKEIVTDGVDGLLYPPGDVDALADALRRLRDDPALRERLAENGQRRAAAFSPERTASAVTAVYRRVLDWPREGVATSTGRS